MALPMSYPGLRALFNVNKVNTCRFYRGFEELRIASVDRSVHPQVFNNLRYLQCCYFSQEAPNAQKPSTAKPGIIKRILYKSDDIFCNILGRISPWMLQEYGLFKIGFVQFTADAKSVYYINRRIRKEKLQLTDLHWKELHLKKQISNDMAKMTPTVIALCIPIVYYFILPLMFLYPTIFLSNQFLSREKLMNYYLKSYQKRAALYPTILDLVGQKMVKVQEGMDRDSLRTVIETLKLEEQVTVQQVLLARNAFEALQFKTLPRAHLKCLCNLCSLRTMFMPGFMLKRKLIKNMALIQAMDHSINQEGLSTVDDLHLEKLCYERGLNVVHSDKDEMQAWLHRWLQLSAKTNGNDLSLIAHCVALLAIGHPSCSRLQDLPSSVSETQDESR